MSTAPRLGAPAPGLTLAGAIALLAVSAGLARADGRPYELGAGLTMSVLGPYDLAAHLKRPELAASGNDLGPGSLGGFVHVGARLPSELTLGAEAALSIGGLVGTDERYLGGRSPVGATLTLEARLSAMAIGGRGAGWVARLGGTLGLERMVEATDGGSVSIDSLVGGPAFGVELGRIAFQLRGDIHMPLRATIGDLVAGDPSGAFFSVGARIAVVLEAGPRY